MMHIIRYCDACKKQKKQAQELIKTTIRIHNTNWESEREEEATKNIFFAVITAHKSAPNMCLLLCLVDQKGDVVSVLYVCPELIDEGPMKGQYVYDMLWCCTDERHRRKNITFLFHKSVVERLICCGNRNICITTDAENEGANRIAKRIADCFPSSILVEVHNKENMKVSVYKSNGKDLVMYWQQNQTA